MFTRNRSIYALTLAVAAVGTPSLWAQYENGSIVGTLHDVSGAPVANANVKITNVATGISTQVMSDGDGQYDAPSLRVGVYTVTASAAGFSDSIAQDITVSVGNRQRIDLTFNPGSAATESVQVSGVALQLQTDSSQRDQTISNYQSKSLPLVSRNYSDLLGLVTGVRQAPTAATTTSLNSLVRAGSYNVNGQRSVFNNFLLDGMDNNSWGESNQGFDNQIIAIPPDSVAQFSVVTNNESAEYGHSSGATINVASASGGNKFHGIAYDFLRNTALNASGYFKPNITSNTGAVTQFKKSTFNRNQFGGNVSGPIVRDRAFFFLDYEGFRQVLKPLSVLTVPTQNEIAGQLVVPVTNPLTGATYAANTPIPQSALNPLSRQLLTYFGQIQGLPQNGVSASGLNSNDYAVEAPFTDNSDKGDLRLDYQQNASSSWFLRVSDRKEDAVNEPFLPLPLDGQSNGNIRVLDQQIALGYTHLFGSTRVLDVRLGLSKTKAGKYSLSIGNNDVDVPGRPTNPTIAGGLPAISIPGFTSLGRQTTNPQWQNPSLLDPKINYTWIVGHHSLKFGYEYEHLWQAINDNNPLGGSFTFSGGYSTVAGQKSAVSDNYWADFLFGLTSQYGLANYFVAHIRQTLNSAYAQDDWRVRPNLTLNLGVRWEYGSPYSEQHNNISNFDPTTQTLLTITPGATSQAGLTAINAGGGVYGHTLVNPDLTDFAPRIGFAWSLDPKLVLRGGFGTSFVHYTRAGSGDILAINSPQAQFISVSQKTPTPANACQGAISSSCYVTANQGYPAGLTATFNAANANITWVPKNTRDSYVESYFLDLQEQLSKNIVFDVSYVGNHGLKLQGFLNGNQRNPAAGFARPYGNWPSDITEALNGFWSKYNALQVRYQQQMVGGLTLLNSFTWEHSLDNASASLEGNTPSPQNAFDIAADYSQSDYNLPVANVTSLVYETPFGHGRRFLSRANGVEQAILGGWQVSVINTAQAGTPFNLTYTPGSTNAVSRQISATYRGANEYRPNKIVGQKLIKPTKVAGTGYIQYVNLNALSLPATGTANAPLSPFGDLSRNPARTPMFNETDLDFNKQFDTPIEGTKVEFRSELYNVFNHTNMYLPTSGLAGTTGSSPTGGGLISSTFEPRIVQFALKLIY